MAGNGWCTHPKRQHSTDVKILVRSGELACRNSWGGDLFQSKVDAGQPVSDAGADLPGSYDQPSSTRDDEVTSVITPPDRLPTPTHSTDEDRVVSDRPAPHRDDDDDSRNDAARHDQDERARIMARGSRDAIMRARERHSHRRNRPTGADDDSSEYDGGAGDRVVTHQARFSDRFVTSRHTAGTILDGGPVPRSEVERRFTTPADRFDSIPEVDPSFDLPGFRTRASEYEEPNSVEEPNELQEEALEQDHPARYDTSFEHVLQRARRIRESKQQQAARPLRHSRLHAHRETREPAYPVEEPPISRVPSDTVDEPPEPIEQEAHVTEPEAPFEDDLVATADAYLDVDLADELVDYDHTEAEEDTGSYEDIPAERPSRRAGGWLSHFGLRQRGPSSGYDDATITRHASTSYDDQDVYRDDVERDTFEPSWSYDDETDDLPQHVSNDGWADAASEDDGPAEPVHDAAVEAEGYPFNVDVRSYVPDTEPGTAFDAMPELDEDRADEPRVASVTYAARPRTEPWHRQRLTPELPDLDDNLFEETFERGRTSSPADAIDRVPVHEERLAATRSDGIRTSMRSASPRDSFFRAARFRDWNEQLPDDAELGSPDSDHESADFADRLPELDEQVFDLRELVARGGELIDMTIDIAPGIPRECRTCRSFRSADGGARGWCTNEWAFTHRRMVNEDDLACETTIGCWWLPADRYWLVENENGYASPTPRMDELVARQVSSPTRKVSGD